MCDHLSRGAGGGMRVGKGKGYNRTCAANAVPSQNRACVINKSNPTSGTQLPEGAQVAARTTS